MGGDRGRRNPPDLLHGRQIKESSKNSAVFIYNYVWVEGPDLNGVMRKEVFMRLRDICGVTTPCSPSAAR